MRDWERRTYEAWRDLVVSEAKANHDGADVVRGGKSGMALVELIYYLGERYQGKEFDEDGVWFEDMVEGYQDMDISQEGRETCPWFPKGELAKEVKKGTRFQSICLDVNKFLKYLSDRVVELGGRIVRAEIDVTSGLAGVISSVNSILGKEDREVEVLINAAGLAARKFVGKEEASKLYPIKGQTVLVRGEVEKCLTYVGVKEEDELCYMIPRPGSGTTVLGGSKYKGRWDESVDADCVERILERIKGLGWGEGLLRKNGEEDGEGEFEVLGKQVGFRPGRDGGARVEVEGKVEGVWVIHNYGHAGAGYQCSVGCAEDIVKLVEELAVGK